MKGDAVPGKSKLKGIRRESEAWSFREGLLWEQHLGQPDWPLPSPKTDRNEAMSVKLCPEYPEGILDDTDR